MLIFQIAESRPALNTSLAFAFWTCTWLVILGVGTLPPLGEPTSTTHLVTPTVLFILVTHTTLALQRKQTMLLSLLASVTPCFPYLWQAVVSSSSYRVISSDDALLSSAAIPLASVINNIEELSRKNNVTENNNGIYDDLGMRELIDTFIEQQQPIRVRVIRVSWSVPEVRV